MLLPDERVYAIFEYKWRKIGVNMILLLISEFIMYRKPEFIRALYFFYNYISTHLLTVLINGCITYSEQRKGTKKGKRSYELP